MESTGSIYVVQSKTHKRGWRLGRTFYVDGKRCQRAVPLTAWSALGFEPGMTLEQARAHAHQLNSTNRVSRAERSKVIRIANRVELDELFHATFVPEHLNQQFLAWMDANSGGNEAYRLKMRIHWGTVKKMLIALKLLPMEYASNRKVFYRYLQAEEYSIQYAKKLIRVTNLYGAFAARLLGKFYDPLPMPKGHDREMIADAYLDSPEFKGASEPLTPEELARLKEKLPIAQYNWLLCTVWLGLRPSEVEMILADKDHRWWRIEPGEKEILWVYQPKLTAKPRAERWKGIPILFPEQMKALAILKDKDAAKPLGKTIRKHCKVYLTLYGGRKGFTDLMLSKGQRLEDISQWLGHSSIEMTWQKYKNKKKVHYTGS